MGFSLDKLALRPMASGHLQIELTETVGWDEFPKFAAELTTRIGATVYDRTESVEMRIWYLRCPTCQITLVFDDFPMMISLESDSPEGDAFLQVLVVKLK